MEPIGTITKYYPFLNDETRRIVEGLVEDAMSYYDFVHSLVDAADAYPMESELAFLAILLSIMYPDSWNRMKARCPESPLTRPFSLMRFESLNPLSREQSEELDSLMREAISSEPPEWILFFLNITAAFEFPEPMRTEYFDAGQSLTETRSDLHCFSAILHSRKAFERRMEGDIETALQLYDKAIEIDNEYDDVFSAASTLSTKANTVKDFDIHRAIQLHDEAYSLIADRLTDFDATYLFARRIGMTYETMGEYDLALRFYQKDFETHSKFADHAQETQTLVAARVYCELGMPQQALEWLQSRSESLRFEDSYLHSITVRVFILLGRLDDAARYLVKANKMAIESGRDATMVAYLQARGLYELVHEEFDAAMNSFQESLSLSSPHFQVPVNYALIGLTQVEVAKAIDSKVSSLNLHTSGPWMSRLEEHALERNYHGIRFQHALLKADYQVKIGEHEAAMQTLNEALGISDSPGVKTFRKRIYERLEELEAILR